MPVGRPTKLTPEVAAQIVKIVSEGNFFETACHAAGVHPTSVRKWVKRGEELLDAEPDPLPEQAPDGGGEPPPLPLERTPDELLAIEFALDLRQARAKVQIGIVSDVRKATDVVKQKGAMWVGERLFPKELGKTERKEISGPDGGPIETTQRAPVMFLPPKSGE